MTATKANACDLPGTAHGDNHKSDKLGNEMIKQGASACELAQAYDEHKADFSISQKEMKDSSFFKEANGDLKKELAEYAQEGHGAPGITGYEVKDAIQESKQ